jgi:hypothetical protein
MANSIPESVSGEEIAKLGEVLGSYFERSDIDIDKSISMLTMIVGQMIGEAYTEDYAMKPKIQQIISLLRQEINESFYL